MASSLPCSRDKVQQLLNGYLASGDSLKILVAGKMGVGKSSLINSIYGGDLSKEDTCAASVTDEIVSFTTTVPTPYMHGGREGAEKVKDSTITVWDSVGFGDVFASNKDKTVEELVWVVEKAHVLLYCFDIRQRLTEDDARGIIEITRRTHPDIWRNTVFVLTFCNDLKPPPSSEMNPVKFFHRTFKSWQKQITKALKELARVPDEIVEEISIVAAGYRDIQPPGYRNWYTTFWSAIFEKTRDDGQPLLLSITNGRMVNNIVPDISELENQDSAHPYALPVNLFGEKEEPGMTPISSEPPVASHIANGRPASNETQSLPAHLVASVGPSAPTGGGGGIMVQGSPPPDSLEAPPPAASNDRPPQPAADPLPPAAEPPPQLPVEPQARDQAGDQATLAGSTATGAVVGALVGVAAAAGGSKAGGVGRVKMGVGVGIGIGVIGLIAIQLMKYVQRT